MAFRIKQRDIGATHPVYIIAELSANHNQDFELAAKTVEAAAAAGVDAVKFQTYRADTITLDSDLPHFRTREDSPWAGQRLYDLYQKAYTPWEWQPRLKAQAESLGLDCFSSPFDFTAIDFLEEMNVPVYKIASFEITDIPLIERAAATGKPIIISTGIADERDIQLAVDACRRQGNEQIALLKCTSAYPTPMEAVNLRTIPLLAEKYGTTVGLSDHTMGLTVPVAAVTLGACIIEKHIILDRELGGVDSAFSLDVAEFTAMVQAVRDTEKALGKATLEPNAKMLSAKRSARSLFAVAEIAAGEPLTTDNVRSLRPGLGMAPKHYHEVLGKKARTTIARGTPLSWDLLAD
ncbi:MAG: pseudaminic acid synthase [Bacteroidota bacterium]